MKSSGPISPRITANITSPRLRAADETTFAAPFDQQLYDPQ
jgi:hypothetical protein